MGSEDGAYYALFVRAPFDLANQMIYCPRIQDGKPESSAYVTVPVLYLYHQLRKLTIIDRTSSASLRGCTIRSLSNFPIRATMPSTQSSRLSPLQPFPNPTIKYWSLRWPRLYCQPRPLMASGECTPLRVRDVGREGG